MCDFRDIANVEDYLREPYLDCNYVRICGGLLRLRKTYTAENYRRPTKGTTLAGADLIKTQSFNINNKKLDLMVSIYYRRDGNIIHLQNKIKYLESLTPAEVEKLHCRTIPENCHKERICVAIKDKLYKIMSRMSRMGCGEEHEGYKTFRSMDTEELAKRLKDPDEILQQLDRFEEQHLKAHPKLKTEDKSVQTDPVLCLCGRKSPRRGMTRQQRRHLPPGGDYIYQNEDYYAIPIDEPEYLYKNYDYDYVHYDDGDNYSLNCEAISSGRGTIDSWNTYILKYKSLIEEYNKKYRNNYMNYGKYHRLSPQYEWKRHRSCSPPKPNIHVQKRSKSVPKEPVHLSKPNGGRFKYSTRFLPPVDKKSLTTLYFNNTLSNSSSVCSDYYSETSTYSGFYTQNHLKRFFEYNEDDFPYEWEYDLHCPKEYAPKKRRGKRNVNLLDGYRIE